jgi:hypothetical protein
MFSTATVNSVFLENMRRLWRHDPRLAQRIDELPLEARLEVQPSKAGPMTAAVSTADGRRLYLHSRYDPRREALDFCKSFEEREAYAVVLSGLGLGYHVKALVEVLGEETVVLVSEPDLVTIKTALEHTDLSKELGAGRVEFLASLEKNVLHERLHRHYAVLLLGTALAVPPAAREHNADFHAACRQAVLDYAAFSRMSLVTLLHNAEITCRNVINNLPTYVATPSPEILRRRFVGHPAILVAAGPSLARNIDQLRGLQDRAVIIVAQTTLRLLLSKGIRPHFVTSLDFSEMSRQFFEGVEIPPTVLLVAEPKATWHVVDVFRGTGGLGAREADHAVMGKVVERRVVLLDNEFARRCVGDDPARRASIEAGATVMHLAFYLAQWLGCDPIIFIGQDLAFTGHCYYAPGVTMHRTWYPELGRFGTLEMKEWERIVRQRAILRKVRDVSGRDIYTDEQMFTYLEQFERDFARCAARIVDATEGGACKRGATAMTLREAAEQYCLRPIPAECFPSADARWYDASTLRPARAALTARLEELAAFRKLCDETAEILKELEGLVHEPPKFNRRIVRVDELRTMVQEHETIFRMVRDVSQLAEFQKFAADRRIAGDDVHGGALARRQLQRDGQFVAALLDGCERLRRILEEGLARFDQEIERSSR